MNLLHFLQFRFSKITLNSKWWQEALIVNLTQCWKLVHVEIKQELLTFYSKHWILTSINSYYNCFSSVIWHRTFSHVLFGINIYNSPSTKTNALLKYRSGQYKLCSLTPSFLWIRYDIHMCIRSDILFISSTYNYQFVIDYDMKWY